MITIICPVYNAQQYLDKAIKSVVFQTYTNWELILINDYSSDESANILSKWKLKDKRIKVYNHKINKGVDQARFTGIEHSNGKYLMFLDSDDWLALNALELMLAKIESENADIVCGSFVRVMDTFGLIKSKPSNSYSQIREKSISQPELFDDYYISYFGITKLRVSMWGKLYRKSTLDKAKLKPSFFKMGEDLMFNMYLHPFLTKVAFIEQTVYYYKYGGMTSTSNPTFLNDIKHQYLNKKYQIEKYSYDKATRFIKIELVNCFYSHFYNQKILDKLSNTEIEQNIKNELLDPIYGDLNVLTDNEKSKKILSLDVEGIIDSIEKQYKKNRFNHKVKKIVSKLLN